MLESKFLFVAKIFLISFFVINLPTLLPLDLFEVSYFFIVTTTIFDTSSLLVLSLSISKFIHIKNLKKIESTNMNIKVNEKNDNELVDQLNFMKLKINKDNQLSFLFAILFAFFTLIQPIILIIDINKNDLYSSAVVNSINMDFEKQTKIIEDLIFKEKSQIADTEELNKLERRIQNLTFLKDQSIDQFLKNNNSKKFNDVKIIIRNLLLGSLWTICFYKIYKI